MRTLLGRARVVRMRDTRTGEVPVYLDQDPKTKSWRVRFQGYGAWDLHTLLYGYPAEPPLRLDDRFCLDLGGGVFCESMRELLETAILNVITGGAK